MIQILKNYEANYVKKLDPKSIISKTEFNPPPCHIITFIATIPAKEYLELFKQLIEFLEDAVKKNKTVRFS